MIFTLLVQTATAFWWVSGIDSQVICNTARIDRMHAIEQTLARIDEKLKSLTAAVKQRNRSVK